MATEGAFGKLKGRFRVLHCKYIKKVMGLTCLVLHICAKTKGTLYPENVN